MAEVSVFSVPWRPDDHQRQGHLHSPNPSPDCDVQPSSQEELKDDTYHRRKPQDHWEPKPR